jgi:hypothetical protein
MAHDELNDGRHREGRRSFLKKVGVGAAVAWTAPTIASTRALAQATCGISDPTDIPGLFAWYDGADPTTINPPSNPNTDVPVQEWWDKSGNARHLEQLTLANQPLWRFNTGINGLGSVEFFGNEFLDWMAADPGFAALTSATVFYVARNDVSPDGPVLWGYDSSAGNSITAWQIGGADVTSNLGGTETFTIASNGNATGTDGTNYTLGTDLVTVTQSTTVSTLRVNLTPRTLNLGNPAQDLTPSVASGGNADMLRVGANDLTTQAFFDGQIGEIIIYNSVLTAAEIDAIECYLNLKWFV